MSEHSNLLFVYDSLKRGGSWHHLLHQAKFLGSGRTMYKNPMVIKENNPYLLEEAYGAQVYGELYEINTEVSRGVEAYYQNPQWFHSRLKSVLVDDKERKAFIYYLHPRNYSFLGNWHRLTHISIFALSQDD